MTKTFEKTELLYANSLAGPEDLAGFREEGSVAMSFPNGRLRLGLENRDEPLERKPGQNPGHFVYWCPEDFPDDIAVSWEFRPLSDQGLAMFWIAASGQSGEDLFSPSLAPRQGLYKQYHHGDINALHLSYFRRNPSEISFRTCHLRKSHGFHLVAQAADPLPDVRYVSEPYQLEVVKSGPDVQFTINDLPLLHWIDPGDEFGPTLAGGKIGFRQMAGLIAEYANLRVHRVVRV